MADVGYQVASAAYSSQLDQYPHHHNHNYHRSPDLHGSRKQSTTSLYDRAASATMAASSSMSPPFIPSDYGGVGTGIAYGAPLPPASISGASDKNGALSSLNLNFLKSLTDKKTTRDGQAPKRRGPKPDSKPALTRRQELNRQAQRTHRERKELYIKALEDEVMRLKEIYSNVSHDKDRLADENRSLKAMLQQNGVPIGSNFLDDSISNPASAGPYIGSSSSATGSYGGSGAGHASASSQNTPYTPPSGLALSTSTAMRGLSPGVMSPASGPGACGSNGHSRYSNGSGGQTRNPGVDYDQAGIDFVLKLEKPCMDHMPWLLERSSAAGGLDPCGHALMASCPPEPFSELTPDIPFGPKNMAPVPQYQSPISINGTPPSHPQAQHTRTSSVSRNFSRNGSAVKTENSPITMDVDGANGSGMRTWQLSKGDLSTLLDLSKRLNLDGEFTPVMAWRMVLGHPRLGELNERDFMKLGDELMSKVRCYGFGAVMEEFEVRDALESIISTKPDNMVY